MFQIDIMSRIPVYEQIIRQTEKFILIGVLNAGDKLPSVRQLSAELSINPNTIQKAFTELDRKRRYIFCQRQGVILCRTRHLRRLRCHDVRHSTI